MTKATIEIVDLSFEIGGRRLLRDVNLTATAGSVYGLFGPNGSGKTTLLNLLSGLHKPTSGQIALHGQIIKKYDPYYMSRLKTGLARSFQVPAIVNDLSVLDNLLLAYRLPHEGFSTLFFRSRLDQNADQVAREEILKMLERFDLAQKSSEISGTLSYGERRIIANLRAILTNAQIVLLDEPFANVNMKHVATFKTLLRALACEGRTIVLIEHLPDNLLNLADSLLHLHRGKLEIHQVSANAVEDLTTMLHGSMFQYE